MGHSSLKGVAYLRDLITSEGGLGEGLARMRDLKRFNLIEGVKNPKWGNLT